MSRIDILNRDRYVEQLCTLVENISLNKTSTCFAIDGAWGSGKSFVLDLFQERLEKIQSKETADNKYFVMKYNCWKYDYYDEPLVSIVASLIDIINKKTKLISDETKSKAIEVLKQATVGLSTIVNKMVKEKTGIDIQEVIDIIKNGMDKGSEENRNKHLYDSFF